jgi:hypothetical protein
MGARLRACAVVMCAASVLVACGSSPESERSEPQGAASFRGDFSDARFYPVFASSEVVVGRNRFLVGLLDDNDAPVARPAIDMHIAFYDLDESASRPESETDLEFVWIRKPYQGIYAGMARFDSAGEWGAEVTLTGAAEETLRTSFEVTRRSTTPALGAPAPSIDTPTASDVGGKLGKISTDPDPMPRLYRLSVEDALRRGKPFVVAFATPKFCVSQTCGPTVDVVEEVARDFPKMTFIHVEPYELPADPGNLQPVQAVMEWGLPSEPWVFVVDARGRVAAKFEGALSAGELADAVRAL